MWWTKDPSVKPAPMRNSWRKKGSIIECTKVKPDPTIPTYQTLPRKTQIFEKESGSKPEEQLSKSSKCSENSPVSSGTLDHNISWCNNKWAIWLFEYHFINHNKGAKRAPNNSNSFYAEIGIHKIFLHNIIGHRLYHPLMKNREGMIFYLKNGLNRKLSRSFLLPNFLTEREAADILQCSMRTIHHKKRLNLTLEIAQLKNNIPKKTYRLQRK